MTEWKDEAEKTLDPVDEAGWAELRALGHRMLDGIFDHVQGVRQGPVWREMPGESRLRLDSERVPHAGQGAAAAYESFVQDVLPYGIGNVHPRFWGWVMGSGTPVGMLAEMLAAGMNPNVGGFNDSAMMVEEQVIRWMAELDGDAGGDERSADERGKHGEPDRAGRGEACSGWIRCSWRGIAEWADAAGVRLDRDA